MEESNIKKLSISGLLCALAVVGSLFSFPVLGSKCAPIQHMINILCAVIFGPFYGVAGTAILGGLFAYPTAIFIMGKSMKDIVFYTYIIPFFISTFVGSIIAGVFIYSIMKTKILTQFQIENSKGKGGKYAKRNA